MEVLLANVHTFSKHVFANYVMQHFFEFYEPSYHKSAVEILASCPGTFGADTYAASVVAAACVHSTEENQLLLARALVANEGLLLRMARQRKGSQAVKAVLNVLEGSELEAVCKQLAGDLPALQSKRYGRAVAHIIGESSAIGACGCDSDDAAKGGVYDDVRP